VPVGREPVPPVGNGAPPPTVTVVVAYSVCVTVIFGTGGQVAPPGADFVSVGELSDVNAGGNPDPVPEGPPGEDFISVGELSNVDAGGDPYPVPEGPPGKVEGRSVGPGPSPVPVTPVGIPPVGFFPVGNIPVGRTPVGRTPVGRTPVGRTPIGRTPVGTGM